MPGPTGNENSFLNKCRTQRTRFASFPSRLLLEFLFIRKNATIIKKLN